MKIEFEIERLWRRDCQDCTHAYYLPYKGETRFQKFLRRIFGLRRRFQEPCKACGSKNVVTTKLVERKIINKKE